MRPSPPVDARVIKRLGPRLARDDVARRQFRVETEVLAALAGRGAPRMVDAGEDARGPWLRMERVAMPTLREHMHTSVQPLAPAWLARAARAALAALAAVHDAADDAGPLLVVHGDVSPANLAVSDDGARAVLLDFGLASGARWPRARGDFRGTVLYAAPEVARGEAVDARADLFALGASLLHAASGEAPRAQGSLAAAIAAAAEEPLDAWAARAADRLAAAGEIPLAIVLTRCVAFDPAARPASARAARAAAGA